MTHAVDNAFVHAVRKASLGLFTRNESDRSKVDDLVEYLRSGQPIGPTEREYLAGLLAGEFRRGRGRPAMKAPTRAARRAALARVNAVKVTWRAEGRTQPFHAAALEKEATGLNMPLETLAEWARTKKHEIF
jgi:hypothetical protein